MGTREVVFIEGEASLHPRWLAVVSLVAARGIHCDMTTGGRGVTEAMAQRLADAGLSQMSLSIDGLQDTHDILRNLRGSYTAAMNTIGHGRAAGMTMTANTQVNRLNMPEIEPLGEALFHAGVAAWQVQITGPIGPPQTCRSVCGAVRRRCRQSLRR